MSHINGTLARLSKGAAPLPHSTFAPILAAQAFEMHCASQGNCIALNTFATELASSTVDRSKATINALAGPFGGASK